MPVPAEELVGLLATFIDPRSRPRVREVEESDRYQEDLIEQMKELGLFGVAGH